ncbi:MAG: hypothetical protein U0R50_05635 [Gaiellales bacterium]
MRLALVIVGAATVTTAVALASPQTTPALLRLDGVGPLKLGMTRQAAVATGWLAHRSHGCELGGKPYPITYRLDGPRAPSTLRASAEFVDDRLRTLSFSAGARTGLGIEPGRSTAAQMVTRYRAAGFSARSRYDSTFQGTFVTVRRNGATRIGGFAERGKLTILAIPGVSVCE